MPSIVDAILFECPSLILMHGFGEEEERGGNNGADQMNYWARRRVMDSTVQADWDPTCLQETCREMNFTEPKIVLGKSSWWCWRKETFTRAGVEMCRLRTWRAGHVHGAGGPNEAHFMVVPTLREITERQQKDMEWWLTWLTVVRKEFVDMGPMMKAWMSKVHWFCLMKRTDANDSPGERKQGTPLNPRRTTILSATEELWQMNHKRTHHGKPETQCSVFHQEPQLGCQARGLPLGYFSWAVPDGHFFSMGTPLSFVHWSFLPVRLAIPRETFFTEAFFPETFLESFTPEAPAFSTSGTSHFEGFLCRLPSIRDGTNSIFLCNIMFVQQVCGLISRFMDDDWLQKFTCAVEQALLRLPRCATVHTHLHLTRSQIRPQTFFICFQADTTSNTVDQQIVQRSDQLYRSAYVLQGDDGDEVDLLPDQIQGQLKKFNSDTSCQLLDAWMIVYQR